MFFQRHNSEKVMHGMKDPMIDGVHPHRFAQEIKNAVFRALLKTQGASINTVVYFIKMKKTCVLIFQDITSLGFMTSTTSDNLQLSTGFKFL